MLRKYRVLEERSPIITCKYILSGSSFKKYIHFLKSRQTYDYKISHAAKRLYFKNDTESS